MMCRTYECRGRMGAEERPILRHKRVSGLKLITVLLCCLITMNVASETTKNDDPRISQSRAVAKELGKELITELKHALEKEGTDKAIKVCNIEAPEIATRLSEQYNWDIGRTSLKTRNPNNNPDPWEQSVLQQFEQRKHQGEAIDALEYYEETEAGFRYMKAIPTKGLCLSCHGEALHEPVNATLAELYPEDKATGFKVGDIRGAFTIIQKQ
jgi:uncharacterized protein DUF3365